MTWLFENWSTILEILGALSVVLGLVNRVLPPGKPQWWLTKVIDFLGFLSRRGTSGVIGPLSVPGVSSKEEKREPPKLVALLVLTMATISASGCASAITTARKTITASFGVFTVSAQAIRSAEESLKDELRSKLAREVISEEAATAQYRAWAVKRDIALDAAIGLRNSLGAASAVVNAIEKGFGGNLAGMLGEAANALARLYQALKDAGVKLPGGL